MCLEHEKICAILTIAAVFNVATLTVAGITLKILSLFEKEIECVLQRAVCGHMILRKAVFTPTQRGESDQPTPKRLPPVTVSTGCKLANICIVNPS